MTQKPQGQMFNLDAMPDGAALNTAQTAVAVGKSTRSLERWRREIPDHPLKWFLIGRQPHYLVAVVRQYVAARAAYLTGGERHKPAPAKLHRKPTKTKPAPKPNSRRAARKTRPGEVVPLASE